MSRRGFTLVELLVVMGIMLVLMALLLPMANRAYRNAVRASMQSDLQVIEMGLDAYKNDFGDYPRTGLGAKATSPGANNTPVQGAALLCWALVAPGPASQDGAGQMNGTVPATPDLGAPGFRNHPTGQGKVHGEYINADRFKLGTMTGGSNTVNPFVPSSGKPWDDVQTVLADRYGNIILYFPGNLSASPSSPTQGLVGSYPVGTPPAPPTAYVYNFSDNSTASNPIPAYLPTTVKQGQSALTLKVFAYRLGHTSALTGSATGPIRAGETPIIAPYLLWCAGPDGQFGPQLMLKGATLVSSGQDDDVTYPENLVDFPALVQP